MTYFLSQDDVHRLGLGSVGTGVLIDRDARLFNPQSIRIGNHVRIDAQAILSAGGDGITIGDHVHISAGAYLYGGGGQILLEDFTSISGRAIIYTATDDFAASHLHGWMVPDEFCRVTCGPVILRRHSGLGAGAIVLPGVEIGFGGGAAPMTVLRQDVPECCGMIGNPARATIVRRDRAMIERLEADVRRRYATTP